MIKEISTSRILEHRHQITRSNLATCPLLRCDITWSVLSVLLEWYSAKTLKLINIISSEKFNLLAQALSTWANLSSEMLLAMLAIDKSSNACASHASCRNPCLTEPKLHETKLRTHRATTFVSAPGKRFPVFQSTTVTVLFTVSYRDHFVCVWNTATRRWNFFFLSSRPSQKFVGDFQCGNLYILVWSRKRETSKSHYFAKQLPTKIVCIGGDAVFCNWYERCTSCSVIPSCARATAMCPLNTTRQNGRRCFAASHLTGMFHCVAVNSRVPRIWMVVSKIAVFFGGSLMMKNAQNWETTPHKPSTKGFDVKSIQTCRTMTVWWFVREVPFSIFDEFRIPALIFDVHDCRSFKFLPPPPQKLPKLSELTARGTQLLRHTWLLP